MTITDQFHSTPSIALDANGYIHVFGPMHNSNMDYWKSILPLDVSAGFSRRDAAADGLWLGVFHSGHHWITYPYVFYDNQLNPWVAFRSRAGTSGWTPGTQCAQLAKFNSLTNRWEPKGGNSNPDFSDIPGNPDPKPNCFAWSEYSQDGSNGYQAWYVKPFIDRHNRLHYSFRHVRDTGSTSWGQDLFYIYSDDEGASWATADGDAVAGNPVAVVDLNSKPRVWWADGPTGNNDIYGAHSGVSNGRPVVGYERRQNGEGPTTTQFAIFEDGVWTQTDTGISAFPGRLLIDSHDVWILLAGRYVHESANNGRTWKTHDTGLIASAQNANYDVRHFKRSNKIRFVATPKGDSGSKRLMIAELVYENWAPPEPVTKVPKPPEDLIAN